MNRLKWIFYVSVIWLLNTVENLVKKLIRCIFLLVLIAQLQADQFIYMAKFTAYCACEKCCGKWADGITASNTLPHQGRTLALPKNFAFGSRVYIKDKKGNYKYLGLCEDRGNPKYIYKKDEFICIDVFFSKHEDAKKFGVKFGTVKILKPKKDWRKATK